MTSKPALSLLKLFKESLEDNTHQNVTIEVTDGTNVNDFAKAVAKSFDKQYGTHNIKEFMSTLHSELGIK